MDMQPKVQADNFQWAIKVIDTHTAGESTRIIYSGLPILQGNTMSEKKIWMEKNCDQLRTALMLEPRGHHDMLGAVLCEPVNAECQLGILFIDTGGFLNMCGHGTIGVATMLVECGLVKIEEPYTYLAFDTPAGIIKTRVKVDKGKVLEVSLTNLPSFLYKDKVSVNIEGREIPLSISFGGNFFALVDTQKALGMDVITAKDVPYLTTLGGKIRQAVNDTFKVQHPELDINTVDLVEFYCSSPNKGKAHMRNVVIFGDTQADRSPCGTGTSAKLAQLHAQGKIKVGEEFIYESFLETIFRGVILEECSVGSFSAIIPQITGSAYITGTATYLIDVADPLKYGFNVG